MTNPTSGETKAECNRQWQEFRTTFLNDFSDIPADYVSLFKIAYTEGWINGGIYTQKVVMDKLNQVIPKI